MPDPYLYPGTDVLRNRWNVRDAEKLERLEAEATTITLYKIARDPIPGNYDLDHLRAFHKEIFKDVYPWAGEIRTINIVKGDTEFAKQQHVATYLNGVFEKLKQQNYLRDLDRDAFIDRSTDLLADLNAAHPFREGNGRSQRAFVGQLAEQAGYHIRWEDLDADRNIEASRAVFNADNGPMRDLLNDITDARVQAVEQKLTDVRERHRQQYERDQQRKQERERRRGRSR